MYRIILILNIVFSLLLPVFGQQEVVLVVRNLEDRAPVAGAHLKNLNGSIMAVSDVRGYARLKTEEVPFSARISHLSYADTIIMVEDVHEVNEVWLKPTPRVLKPFAVIAEPENLIPDKPWFVTSYSHTSDGLLLLAYPQRKLSNQSLFLLNFDNEVITSVPFAKQGDLVKDATDAIWLKTKSWLYSVTISPDTIRVGDEMIPTADFEAGLARIALVCNDKYYFAHFTCDHQRLDYYYYDARVDKVRLFETVFDDLGMRLRETRDIFETNEFERRFGEMCFFRPVVAPLFKTTNRLLMVNYAEGKLLFYDSLPSLVQEVSLAWIHQEALKEEVLFDRVTGRFYALFESNGVSCLREIDLMTGELGSEINIPGFPYVSHLTVHQGHLYFLYKEQTYHEYRKIFRMPLPGTGAQIATR